MNYTKSIGSANYTMRLQVSSQLRSHSRYCRNVCIHMVKDGWSNGLQTKTVFLQTATIQDPYNLELNHGPLLVMILLIFSRASFRGYRCPLAEEDCFSTSSSFVNHIIGNWQLNRNQ